jgi:RNA polymerase sigma factor (sigma-70 family)
MNTVTKYLRRALHLSDDGQPTDGNLLERFIRDREPGALSALVKRHSSMVWQVCQRVLRDPHDVEDAYQTTFLVLARRAASIVPREMVANWLYGVAHRTALKARAAKAKRHSREKQVPLLPESAAPESAQAQDLWARLKPLLDQELSNLPSDYRAVVVLCDLEGKTRKEAAQELGLREGTVASRLARARALLAGRLACHGIRLSGAALAAVVASGTAAAAVPAGVVSSTIAGVGGLAAEPGTIGGAVTSGTSLPEAG